jgi:Cof subfamily protein (haloacid dehalogenase superfamily)
MYFLRGDLLYKLIALDLDGTLLDDNKKISTENIITINNLINKGLKVVIATGRGYYSAKKLTEKLDKKLTILANNGNIIRNTSDDLTIFARYMEKEIVKDILIEGKKINLNPIVHVDYFTDGIDMVIEENISDNFIERYISKNPSRFKAVSNNILYNVDRVLALVYLGSRERLNVFYQGLIDKYPKKHSSHILNNIQVAEAMLEIMNPFANKGVTLLEYCNSIGIKAEEVIAIGDDNNDIDMIKNVGLGIAMKNGSELVKGSADIVTEEDNNNSGVAYILNKIFDSERVEVEFWT